MNIDFPTPGLLPAQRALWQGAFGDGDAFLDAFFSAGFSPRRCRCITLEGRLAAAVYWFDFLWQGRKLAYIYGLAVDGAFRGRGLGRALLEDTENLLRSQKYAGALLVPGSASLFSYYGKMGYIPLNCAENILVSATSPIPVRKIDIAEYNRLRDRLLGQNGIILGAESSRFLASHWTLFAGKDWVLAGFDRGAEFVGMELLGDTAAAGGLLASLGRARGTFRIPGKNPFAMYKPLNFPHIPDNFLLAFD